MSANFRDLFPWIEAPLNHVAAIGWVKHLNETTWLFALVETSHLVFLVILGGAVTVLNLRLLNVLLTDAPPADVEAATRPWFRAGVWGTVISGTYMGVATVVTLLPSKAFFVKMVALIAAILLSHAVARRVRHAAAPASGSLDPVAIAALLLWLAAFALFAGTTGLGAGATLVVLGGLALVVAAWLAGRREGVPRQLSPLRVSALSSLLAWLTVAAAGRWIGFS